LPVNKEPCQGVQEDIACRAEKPPLSWHDLALSEYFFPNDIKGFEILLQLKGLLVPLDMTDSIYVFP